MRFGESEREPEERKYRTRTRDRPSYFLEAIAAGGALLAYEGYHDGMPPSCVIGGILMAPLAIKWGIGATHCAIDVYKSVRQGYRNHKAEKINKVRANIRIIRKLESPRVYNE